MMNESTQSTDASELEIGTVYENKHGRWKVVGKRPDHLNPDLTQYKIRALAAETAQAGHTEWMHVGDLEIEEIK